jgi:hypothetical protein
MDEGRGMGTAQSVRLAPDDTGAPPGGRDAAVAADTVL